MKIRCPWLELHYCPTWDRTVPVSLFLYEQALPPLSSHLNIIIGGDAMDSAVDVVNRDGIVNVVTWNSIRILEAFIRI